MTGQDLKDMNNNCMEESEEQRSPLGSVVDLQEVIAGAEKFRLQFTYDEFSKEMKWVVFVGKRRGAIGKIIFTLEEEDSSHVKAIDIHKSYRGIGLSKILYMACLATLRQRGIRELTLEAEEDTRRHQKLVSLYQEWGFIVKAGAKVLYLYNNTDCLRKVPMTLSLHSKNFVPLVPNNDQRFCMISLQTTSGLFLTASEDGMIEPTKGKSRNAFWQSLLNDSTTNDTLSPNNTKSNNNTICLRSCHGKFLCVELDGNILADRFVNSTWETFEVLPFPEGGGVSLRSFHGNYLGIDINSNQMTISSTPCAWDGEGSLSLVFNKDNAIPLHIKIMRKHQTKEFVSTQRQKFNGMDHATFSILEACKALVQLNGESELASSVILKEMLLAGEKLREEGHPDWLQLIVFLRGLGAIFLLWADDENMVLRSITMKQWLHQCQTWVIGMEMPEQLRHSELNASNNDQKSQQFNGEFGMYASQCGMENVWMPWTPDEYLYRVLSYNKTSLPLEALQAVRFYSCDVWYHSNAYQQLCAPQDFDTKELLANITSCNQMLNHEEGVNDCKVDVNVESTLPYYLSLCEKYLPSHLHW